MREAFYTGLLFVIALGLVLVCFWMYKHFTHKVVIDPNDHSMESIPGSSDPREHDGYSYGSHRLTQPPQSAKDVLPGAAVAYMTPGSSEKRRVGWVLAVEGQRLEVRGGEVYVEGKPGPRKILNLKPDFPEVVVPRGCAFVWAHIPEDDSSWHGAIPVRNILGHLK